MLMPFVCEHQWRKFSGNICALCTNHSLSCRYFWLCVCLSSFGKQMEIKMLWSKWCRNLICLSAIQLSIVWVLTVSVWFVPWSTSQLSVSYIGFIAFRELPTHGHQKVLSQAECWLFREPATGDSTRQWLWRAVVPVEWPLPIPSIPRGGADCGACGRGGVGNGRGAGRWCEGCPTQHQLPGIWSPWASTSRETAHGVSKEVHHTHTAGLWWLFFQLMELVFILRCDVFTCRYYTAQGHKLLFFLIYTMSQMFRVIVCGDSCACHLSAVS